MSAALMNVLNIAHRGASSLAPENTLAAAQLALTCGADMWEVDVGLTADDQLILLHDDTLARTSNVVELFPQRQPWRLHQFTLAEIRQLDFGSWFVKTDPFGQIAAGQVPATDLAAYAGERAPTLAEALEFTWVNDWRINVEIKDLSGTPGDAHVVEKLVHLVEQMKMIDRTLVSSFNHHYLRRIKALNPRIATAVLVEEAAADPRQLLGRLAAQAYHPPASALQPQIMAELRQAGYEVNVWTVDEVGSMRRLIGAGVSGIITNFPHRLRQVSRLEQAE
jgi:glycerophosphoryl diester phosphodiesterase